MSKPRIEVYHAADGSWRYRVLAANGETLRVRGLHGGIIPFGLSTVHNSAERPEYLTTDPPPEGTSK